MNSLPQSLVSFLTCRFCHIDQEISSLVSNGCHFSQSSILFFFFSYVASYFLYYLYRYLAGNFRESLNDAEAAVNLQPTYIKAIARGKACYFMKLNVIYIFGRIRRTPVSPRGLKSHDYPTSRDIGLSRIHVTFPSKHVHRTLNYVKQSWTTKQSIPQHS